jgi:23S rRNA (adenine2503-C2)-methyltransferase
MTDARRESPADTRIRTDLLSLREPQMAQLVRTMGWPAYRAGQILRWLYRHRVRAIDEMTDLPHRDRRRLAEVATIRRSRRHTVLPDPDGTRKLLLTLDDGLTIETVLIPEDDRLTLCVSTQVGCMLDCGFCLTGTMGLKRNLGSGEILDQVLTAQDQLGDTTRLTNLVFMGMGEPLANLEALATAVESLTNKSWGLGWSPRRITVSTAGLASRLNDVAALGVNLAVSLNGTTEEQRRSLMPAVSRIASLKSLMAACRRYPLGRTRRLTFEYVLLAGVNDQAADAQRLAKLVRGLRCKINLIPFNEFPGSRFRRPAESDVLRFQSALRQSGLDAFIRKSRGREVLGACGQLGTLPCGASGVALTPVESRC